jgi:2-dehydro-3-deoxyphosphogluconate aldolase/(4S)-4-hydroxy-2-oxoglutarate aldolase
MAVSAPFPNITFVPTGGITPKNMKEYLALDSVLGVGGSWMFSKSDSEEEYFAKLKEALVEIKE